MKPANKWAVVAMLFFAAGLNYGDRTAITAVFPLLKAELNMSDVELGLTGSLFLWSYAAMSPFGGFLGDRVSRARLVTWSLGAWSLVMFLTGFVTNVSQLFVMRLLLGIPEAAYIPAATALIADYHGPETRAKAIGLHIAGLSTGMVAGGWLSGYLGDHVGWRPPFYILGVAGMILTAICAAYLRDAEPVSRKPEPPLPAAVMLSEIARVRMFWLLTAEIILSGTGSWIFINWMPLFFKETFSLSLAMAGLYGTLWIQSGRVTGLVLGGPPSDRAGKRDPRNRLLIMGCCYLAAAPLLLMFVYSTSFLAIAAAIVAYNALFGFGYVNAQPLLVELLNPRVRSTAVGFMNMGACFAGGFGVLVAGALKSDFGLARSFASLAIVVVFLGLMLLAGYRFVLPKDLADAKMRQAASA